MDIAFSTSVVNYSGPFFKAIQTSNSWIEKVSAATAVYYDVISSMTTEAFIAVLRFVSRSGNAANIYSNNDTNFIGVNNKIKRTELLKEEHEKINNAFVNR